MNERQVLRFADPVSLCEAAAQEFAHASRHAIDARGVFRVALAGGATPRGLYQRLTRAPFRGEVVWDQIEIFFGDERTVAPDDAASNYHMARESFLGELEIDPARVHRMPAEEPDVDAAARRYQHEIATRFGVENDGAPPRFDLILLGMGDDGHTASLFPATRALAETERWVVANPVPELESTRMTFTFPLINAAAQVVFLVCGASKAQAVRDVLEGPRDIARWPAQGVVPGDGSLRFYLDEAAASKLT